MFKNKSYIGISLIILIFGIYVVPKIIEKIKNNNIVNGARLDKVNNSNGESNLNVIGLAPKFELINQNNVKITNDFYKNKVYVLEFFFTSCPSICPKMNLSMLTIQNEFIGNPNFGIASITIDPEKDTSNNLKKYANLLGVKSSNWNFLTGNSDVIIALANKGFNLYAAKNEKITGGFEHSGLFALIDKKGNIRSRNDEFGNPIIYYDGLDKNNVRDLQEDIKLLLKE